MSMTEAEAKTKWCPMARAWDGGTSAPLSICIASACAVWVWTDMEYTHDVFIADPSGAVDEEGELKGTVEKHPELRRGACGLTRQ